MSRESERKPARPIDLKDGLDLLSLGSHQMRSPLMAARSLLQTVPTGYAGSLNERRQDLLHNAEKRCGQAEQAIGRLLTMPQLHRGQKQILRLADSVGLGHRIAEQYATQARERGIDLSVQIDAMEGHIRVGKAWFTEVIQALLDNAFKYTPDYGSIHLRLTTDGGNFELAVTDSGVGIDEHMGQRVFEPFVRTGLAENSSRPGTGLGLALVQAIATSAGGDVRAAKADLGGAEIVMSLPLVKLRH